LKYFYSGNHYNVFDKIRQIGLNRRGFGKGGLRMKDILIKWAERNQGFVDSLCVLIVCLLILLAYFGIKKSEPKMWDTKEETKK